MQPPTSPPGWHDDPNDPTSLRYWDGFQWTEQRAPKPSVQQIQFQLGGWPPLRIAGMVSAVAVVVGSFGPWITASTVFLSVTKNGIEGDGVFTAD
jgi:hypothetical protein